MWMMIDDAARARRVTATRESPWRLQGMSLGTAWISCDTICRMALDNGITPFHEEPEMRRFHDTPVIDETMVDGALAQCWALELLVHHGGINQFVGRAGYGDDDFAEFLGLDPLDEDGDRDLGRLAKYAIKARYGQVMGSGMVEDGIPSALGENTSRLGRLIGANPVELKLLQFAVLMHAHGGLNRAACYIGDLTTHRLIRVLSALLREPATDIKAALAEDAILAESGILKVDRNANFNFPGKLELISNGFADRMLETAENDPVRLFRGILNHSQASSLSAGDYDHMKKGVATVRALLDEACTQRRKGVNVFLYGEPGTGKTEMARLIAGLLGVKGFEVSSEDRDGDPIAGQSRLQAWRAANAMLRNRKALLIFDEVEDVFGDGSLFEPSTAQKRKGWMNRALETNPVPTIWLSNDVSSLDPAFVRRFDLVMEVRQPTRSQRHKMAKAMVGHLASGELLERIALSEHLSPAIMQRAGDVAGRLKAHVSGNKSRAGKKGGPLRAVDLEDSLEMLLDNTLKAQGFRGLADKASDHARGIYDPAFTNADTDLARLAEGLRERPNARICLYGPPGTGKTAYGCWLAEQLDRPLHVKRASDLLGKYVGETERRMANAFREAKDEDAVLLIDEVDSFLQDRSKAHHSWEVSMVNEMLTQMERYEGVFIASTNLMDGLDPATLRRFDLKLKFGYLGPEQARKLFLKWSKTMGLRKGLESAAREVEAMAVLTPGDFAAIARRHRFQPLQDPVEVVEALRGECAMKNVRAERRFGFI